MVGDAMAVDPFENLSDKDIHMEVGDLLAKLDDRERRIINARFGLDGSDPITLEEVGDKFGVTRERIRQLQNIALNKMRRSLNKLEKMDSEKLAHAA